MVLAAVSIGIENDKPILPPLELRIQELMPTTRPSVSIRGPPELPRLIATSDWMNGTYCCWFWVLPLALTMPAVTLCSNWNGDPMAMTHSPGRSAEESPKRSVGRSSASIRMTAMSVSASDPTSSATNSRRSASRTMISSASSMTWWLVMIRPSSRTMKPEPPPRRSGRPRGMPSPKGSKNLRNSSGMSSGICPRCTSGSGRSPNRVVSMLTTAGMLASTISAKSAGAAREFSANNTSAEASKNLNSSLNIEYNPLFPNSCDWIPTAPGRPASRTLSGNVAAIASRFKAPVQFHEGQPRSAHEFRRPVRLPYRGHRRRDARHEGRRIVSRHEPVGHDRARDESHDRQQVGDRRCQHQPARIQSYPDQPTGTDAPVARHRDAGLRACKQPAEQRRTAAGTAAAPAAAPGIIEFQPACAVPVPPDDGHLPDQIGILQIVGPISPGAEESELASCAGAVR